MKVLLLLMLLLLIGCDADDRSYAEAVTGGNVDRGRTAITFYGCASCHVIPGIRGADGLVGPPLDRMAARSYVGGVFKHAGQLAEVADRPACHRRQDRHAEPSRHTG